MNFLGLTISREKAATSVPSAPRGWQTIFESKPGAWQQNVEVDPRVVLAFHAIFACMTLIARDIGKLRVKLVEQDKDGVWSEKTSPAYSPVLRKPNKFQTRNQFFESWMLSKLSQGNTYVFKTRDNRRVVTALHVLDPMRVKPLVTLEGDVYYQLHSDNLAGLEGEPLVVPASEIIHDRFNCLFHPLVGISPIYASGLAATQGQNIQNNSATLFANASQPGGLLIAPGKIDTENATRLKQYWEANYTGGNAGKIAVLGDGLEYKGLATTPHDAQMVEQLKWTAEVVCSTFHVPAYKIGAAPTPVGTSVEALNLEYYSQCLQAHIEEIEMLLDEGLGTGERMGTEFDTDNLIRMDSAAQMEVLEKSKSVLTLDERRRKLDVGKIEGGATIYLQQQDHSIEAIAARDKLLIEQANNPVVPALPAPVEAPANDDEPSEAERTQRRAANKALLRELVRERVNA